MNHRGRVFLFTHYPWIIAILLVTATIAIIFVFVIEKDKLIAAIVAMWIGGISLANFIQKQKIEELSIFEQLFRRFNKRYAKMHCDLQLVIATDQEDLSANQIEVLDKYFNLCAEEFLFYSQGRILQEVWQAWCCGILFYLRHPLVQRYWEGQVKQRSHYGLTVDLIKLSANLPSSDTVEGANV